MFFFSVQSGELELTDQQGNTDHFKIIYNDILAFATGATTKPPVGFSPKPSIRFVDDTFPKGNTCSNELYLPVQHIARESFIYAMTFGILNTVGVGQI